MDPVLTTAIVGGGSALGTGITVSWVAKLLIKRYLDDNEKKHESTSDTLKEISTALSALHHEMSAMRVSIGQIIAIKDRVDEDHDKIIRVETWNEKYKGDLTTQWNRVRDCEAVVKKLNDRIEEIESEKKAQGL